MSELLQEWRHEPLDRDAAVVLVPIRHHSPACARHLRALLEVVRPAAVLIEAPCDAEETAVCWISGRDAKSTCPRLKQPSITSPRTPAPS